MSVARVKKGKLDEERTALDFSDLFHVLPEHRDVLRNLELHRTRVAQLRSFHCATGLPPAVPIELDPAKAMEAATAMEAFAIVEQIMAPANKTLGHEPLFPNLNRSEQRACPDDFLEMQTAHRVDCVRDHGTSWVTFRQIRTANSIRGRSEETARLAGGLLGPYTVEDCEDLETFVATHHRLLDEPATKVEEMKDQAFVFCISYRHKPSDERTFDKDRMSQLEYRNWFRAAQKVCALGETAYFWQDQKAKGVRTDSDLDWISNGIVPYLMCTVIILTSVHGETSDSQRLWMSVEQNLADLKCGYIRVHDGVCEDNYMKASFDIEKGEKAFASMVLHGLYEGKETWHEDDRLRMIRWAVNKLIPVSPETLSSFQDIRNEASVEGEELVQLYDQVKLNPSGCKGLTVSITRRAGLGHTCWSDLLPVFETQHGNIPGAISVRGNGTEHLCPGTYNYVKVAESKMLYYVRFELLDGEDIVLTGKVALADVNDDTKGRVVCGKKIFTTEFSNGIKRLAPKLMYYLQRRDVGSLARAYVDGRKELIETATRRIVAAAWGVSGEVVYYAPSSELEWS